MEKSLREKLDIIIEEETERIIGVLEACEIKEGELLINGEALCGEMCDISIRPHTGSVTVPMHYHTFLEVMIVLSGSIIHHIDGKDLELGCGKILFLNKHMRHSIEPAADGDIAINLIISDKFAESLAPELDGTVFAELLKENASPEGKGVYLCFSAQERRIENLTENLLRELTEQMPRMKILTKTAELLMTYLSNFSDEYFIDGSLSNDRESKRLRAITAYIKDNFKDATLTALGSELYMSVPYLSKYIKEHLGKSFKELLIAERIRQAKKLLTSTDMPISEIVVNVGYENDSYFHREFKKRMGATPLSYRKGICNTGTCRATDI